MPGMNCKLIVDDQGQPLEASGIQDLKEMERARKELMQEKSSKKLN